MEYDNDKIRPPHPRIELFYWSLFILINPVANYLTLFLAEWKMGLLPDEPGGEKTLN